MALQIVNAVQSAVGVAVSLGADDDLLLTRNGVVASASDAAIQATGSFQFVRVDGLVNGLWGMNLGNLSNTDHRLNVSITSFGSVWGSLIGLNVRAYEAVISNSGLIEGDTYGVYLSGDFSSTTSIVVNHGTIHGKSIAIVGGSESLRISNTGTIWGDGSAMVLSSQSDILRNHGLIQGDIALGGGGDIYDGRFGTVDGVIYGENGLDTFRPGASAEFLVGGADTDTVDYRKSAGVVVDLEDGIGDGGRAEGDEYQDIEVVYGSTFGSDNLVGDVRANGLYGFRGLDTLNGGAGNDTLTGGLGQDTVTGGLGNDYFDFNRPGDGGDRILDFRNLVGNDDTIRLSAFGFGGGLSAGVLSANQFVVGTTAAAQDADDRVIWKTTDFTLWFDVNGNAAGGLTLLAKMDSGATVTAADIFIL